MYEDLYFWYFKDVKNGNKNIKMLSCLSFTINFGILLLISSYSIPKTVVFVTL